MLLLTLICAFISPGISSSSFRGLEMLLEARQMIEETSSDPERARYHDARLDHSTPSHHSSLGEPIFDASAVPLGEPILGTSALRVIPWDAHDDENQRYITAIEINNNSPNYAPHVDHSRRNERY